MFLESNPNMVYLNLFSTVEQPSCIAAQPFTGFEDLLTIYIHRIKEHGIMKHLDVVARRELKIEEEFNVIPMGKQTFLSMDEFSYSLLIIIFGFPLALFVFIGEILYNNYYHLQK